MTMSEKTIEQMERKLPARFKKAVRRAYKVALSTGPVWVARGGKIYEMRPDGSRRFVKEIEKPVPAIKGRKYIIP